MPWAWWGAGPYQPTADHGDKPLTVAVWAWKGGWGSYLSFIWSIGQRFSLAVYGRKGPVPFIPLHRRAVWGQIIVLPLHLKFNNWEYCTNLSISWGFETIEWEKNEIASNFANSLFYIQPCEAFLITPTASSAALNRRLQPCGTISAYRRGSSQAVLEPHFLSRGRVSIRTGSPGSAAGSHQHVRNNLLRAHMPLQLAGPGSKHSSLTFFFRAEEVGGI